MTPKIAALQTGTCKLEAGSKSSGLVTYKSSTWSDSNKASDSSITEIQGCEIVVGHVLARI